MSPLPNFFIIGAPKSGTTAIYYGLEQHPDVHLSTPKEPCFFEDEYERGPEYYWQTYFAKGWRGQSAVGDARTANLYLPYVAQRIHETVPDARLIVLLRNPVERAFSHWWMLRCNGREPLRFDAALAANRDSIVRGLSLDSAEFIRLWHVNIEHRNAYWRQKPIAVRNYIEVGYYAQHIERYFQYFSRSQLKVKLYDDLVQSPEDTLRELVEFLGLDPAGAPRVPAPENVALTRFSRPFFLASRRFRLERVLPRKLLAVGRTTLSRIGSRPAISEPAREWLLRHYEPHNRRLEEILGRDLRDWDT